MTKENNLEGVAGGTVMTTGNTAGSGDAASVIVIGTSANMTYDAASAAYGSMGGLITLGSTTSYWRYDETLATGRWVARRTFVAQTVTTGTQNLMSIWSTTALIAQMWQVSTGVLRVADAAAGITASNSPALTMGNKYLLELAVTEGTTTSDGRVECQILNVADGSAFHSYDSGATRNTGTVGGDRVRFGHDTTAKGWTVDRFDALKFGQLASGWWGPPPPSLPTIVMPNRSA